MSVQSNSVYSEKLPVSEPDLEELADPFETHLHRTMRRIYGFSFLIPHHTVLGLLCSIPGMMLADAYVDHLKSEQIGYKMPVRNPKANPDLFIQKEIYSSIQRYTDRSKAIKTVSGLVGIAGVLLLKHALHDFKVGMDANGNFGFLHVNNYTSLEASNVLFLISMGGFCYSVVRRHTEGLQLQADNMALASRLSYAKRKQI